MTLMPSPQPWWNTLGHVDMWVGYLLFCGWWIQGCVRRIVKARRRSARLKYDRWERELRAQG